MATKAKKTATPKQWQLSDSVGLPKPDSSGYTGSAWVAIASHPVHGLMVCGPWNNRAAAISWVEDQAAEYLAFSCVGNQRDYVWSVVNLEVPNRRIY